MTLPCRYCRDGKHRQCRLLKINKELCGCECDFANEFREDVEMYYKLDGVSPLGVYKKLFPWKRAVDLR